MLSPLNATVPRLLVQPQVFWDSVREDPNLGVGSSFDGADPEDVLRSFLSMSFAELEAGANEIPDHVDAPIAEGARYHVPSYGEVVCNINPSPINIGTDIYFGVPDTFIPQCRVGYTLNPDDEILYFIMWPNQSNLGFEARARGDLELIDVYRADSRAVNEQFTADTEGRRLDFSVDGLTDLSGDQKSVDLAHDLLNVYLHVMKQARFDGIIEVGPLT